MDRSLHPFYMLVGVLGGVALAFLLGAADASMAPITTALQDANSEARGPILAATAGILAVVVMIGVAAGIVRVLSRAT